MKNFHHIPSLPELPVLPRVEIKGKRYYQLPSGRKVPSVTTVLDYFKDPAILMWQKRVGMEEAERVRKLAARRGTNFHSIMESYLGNNLSPVQLSMPDKIQTFRSVRPTLDRINDIHYLECRLYSEKLGTAGQADVVGHFDGVLSIIDFKFTSRMKEAQQITNYFEQASAYAEMYLELNSIPIEQIVVIMLSDDVIQPEVFIETKTKYIESFRNKVKTYEKEHSDVS